MAGATSLTKNEISRVLRLRSQAITPKQFRIKLYIHITTLRINKFRLTLIEKRQKLCTSLQDQREALDQVGDEHGIKIE